MFQPKSLRVATCLAVALFCLSSSFYCSTVSAQTSESVEELKAKVLELTEQNKYLEALPLLEKIVVAEPDNARMHFDLGFALIAQAHNTKNAEQQIALSKRARAAFVKARELNVAEPVVDALIASMPLDGSMGDQSFSENIAANSLMTQAEALFSQGKLDEALRNYQKALTFDPKLYHAALFSGDVFVSKGISQAPNSGTRKRSRLIRPGKRLIAIRLRR